MNNMMIKAEMSREDKLYSMKGDMLIAECDKLGVKVSCNKTRTQLKESKAKVIERILAFESEVDNSISVVEEPVIEDNNSVDTEQISNATRVSIKKVAQKQEQENILDYVQGIIISLNMEFKRSVKSIRLFKTKDKIATIFARKSSIRIYMNNAIFKNFNFGSSIIERVNIDNADEINFYIQQDNIESFLNKVMEVC